MEQKNWIFFVRNLIRRLPSEWNVDKCPLPEWRDVWRNAWCDMNYDMTCDAMRDVTWRVTQIVMSCDIILYDAMWCNIIYSAWWDIILFYLYDMMCCFIWNNVIFCNINWYDATSSNNIWCHFMWRNVMWQCDEHIPLFNSRCDCTSTNSVWLFHRARLVRKVLAKLKSF